MLELPGGIRIPAHELEFHYARSSGPGGQNVNKVNSKCVMHWNVHATRALPEGMRARLLSAFANRISGEGFLVLSSDRFRDQQRNFDDCLAKLREMLLSVLHPPRPRKPTRPTRGSKRRLRESKSHRSETKKNRGPVR
jgi:ribosome-associated protein